VMEHNMLKRFAAQMLTAGPIELALTVARERGLGPEEIEQIVVHSTSELVRYAGGPEAARPASREAADHSAPYVIAIALIEGDVLPAQYENRQWEDPRVIELMGKINVVGDPVMDERAERDGSMPAWVEIRARGDVYRADLEYPRGHPGNPMSTDEVEDKFRRLTAPLLFPPEQDAVIGAVADIESADSLAPLLEATVSSSLTKQPAV
jgi:2-methylcitrate dehydratase